MELNQFLNNKITAYIDELVEAKRKNLPNVIRDEEIGIFTNSRDYVAEIRKFLRENNFPQVKKVYREVLDKFVGTTDKEEKEKASKLLEEITKIIKERIKEYNQDMMLKPEFEDYEKLTSKDKKIPNKITGQKSDVKFFESSKDKADYSQAVEAPITQRGKQQQTKPQQPTAPPLFPQAPTQTTVIRQFRTENKEVLKMINLMKTLELGLNQALINQKIKESERIYTKMKNLFARFPDEEYETKVDLYSDLLSANFRLHQLISHNRKLKQKQKEDLELEIQATKIKKSKLVKLKLEQKKIDEEIENLNKKRTEIKKPILPEPKKEIKKEPEKKIEKIKVKKISKDERIEKIKQESLKYEKKHKKENKISLIEKNHKNKIDKIIDVLYKEGLRVMFHDDKKDAKKYFEKILDLNPNYKPAIIRLKSIG